MAYTWLLLITLSTLLIFTVVTSRTITTTSSPDLLSDGLEQERTLGLNPLVSADEPETCEQSYGFLPCTSTALGNLFLILVYGYLMFLAATYLSSGSELLLEILGPGFVGGLLLPSLGALPDAMLILVSGLSGSVEVAQEQVSVGIAGSTVMLITVIWGTCVTVGSGVSTDIWTSDSAMIMAAVSVLPFIVVQFYSVIQPTLQRRRLAFAKHKHLRSRILKLFKSIHVDEDEHLSHSELRALVVGMRLSEINLSEDDAVDKVMKDFDQTENNLVDEKEFIAGIGKWLEEAKSSKIDAHLAGPDTLKYIHEYYEETKKEHDLLGDDGVEDDEEAGVDDPRRTSIKAVLYLLLGTCIAAAFADPLVDAVGGFSTATSIPSFFISFIFLPLATNSSDAVSAIIFATRKKQRSASLTFSELYGAVTMNNNILCLSVFLALVYVRGLTWDFSSEVLVILIVCIVMGVFGSLRTTFPLWTSFIAFALYPFSLVLVYVLDYAFGWS